MVGNQNEAPDDDDENDVEGTHNLDCHYRSQEFSIECDKHQSYKDEFLDGKISDRSIYSSLKKMSKKDAPPDADDEFERNSRALFEEVYDPAPRSQTLMTSTPLPFSHHHTAWAGLPHSVTHVFAPSVSLIARHRF